MPLHFKSDVELGKSYLDPQTGIKGVATSVHFYQYACERVVLEYVKPDGELQEVTFDAPRLEEFDTGKRLTTDRTGGPGSKHERSRSTPSRSSAV